MRNRYDSHGRVPCPDWRAREEQARREAQVRREKDLAGVAYMGKNE